MQSAPFYSLANLISKIQTLLLHTVEAYMRRNMVFHPVLGVRNIRMKGLIYVTFRLDSRNKVQVFQPYKEL